MPLYHIALCKICHQYFCVSPNVNINPIQTFWAMIKLWMPESGPPWWMNLVFISLCQARVWTERKQKGSERSPNARESCIWWTPKPLDKKNYWDLCFWCELCLSLRLDSFQVNIRQKENCELLTAGFCLWSSIRNQKHPGPDGAGRISSSGIKWQSAGGIKLFYDLLQAVHTLDRRQCWSISDVGSFGPWILLSTTMSPSWLDLW